MATFQIIRSFSTSNVAQKLVQTPIQVFGIEGRYATALYSAASKSKKLDQVEKDLNEINKLLLTDKKFREFIDNPSIKRDIKSKAVVDVLTKKSCSDLTKNLFGVMCDNGRLNKTSVVVSAFSRIMSAHKGDVICVVTTATAPDAAFVKEIESTLKMFLKQGESLKAEFQTDPSIIGGMTVSIGDKFVDMSLSKKIKTYSDVLKQSV